MTPSQMVFQQQPSHKFTAQLSAQFSRARSIIAFLTITVSWMLIIAVNAIAAPSGSATGYSAGYSAKSPGSQSGGQSTGGDIFGIVNGVGKDAKATLTLIFGVLAIGILLIALAMRSIKGIIAGCVMVFITGLVVYGGFLRVTQNTSDNIEQYSSGSSNGGSPSMSSSPSTPKR